MTNIFGKTGNGNVKNEDTKDEGLALLRRQPSIRDRKKVYRLYSIHRRKIVKRQHYTLFFKLVKTEIMYPKNVRAKVAMDFT